MGGGSREEPTGPSLIVVDTSVWIDVINEVETPPAVLCIQLLEDGAPIALTDVIFTEVLQGFRTEREANAVERHLRSFPLLRLETVDDLLPRRASPRQAHHTGITIRQTLDCLIAAPVRYGVPILHSDEDFDPLASCTQLAIFG